MPFQSEKQRRYLWANEPEIAREWTNRYGANQGGITRLPFRTGSGEEMISIGTPLRNQLQLAEQLNLPTLNPEFNTGDPYKDNIYEGIAGQTAMLPDNMLQTLSDASYNIENPLGESTDVFSDVDYESFAPNEGGIVDVDQVRELIGNAYGEYTDDPEYADDRYGFDRMIEEKYGDVYNQGMKFGDAESKSSLTFFT